MSDPNDSRIPSSDPKFPLCTCMQDEYSALPPELRPKKKTWKTGLRKAHCMGCWLEYWTNQKDDLCMNCQKNGLKALPKENQE